MTTVPDSSKPKAWLPPTSSKVPLKPMVLQRRTEVLAAALKNMFKVAPNHG